MRFLSNKRTIFLGVVFTSITVNLSSVKAATFSPNDLSFAPNQLIKLEGDFLTGSISTNGLGQLNYFIETEENATLGIPNVIYDSSNGETTLEITEPEPSTDDDEGGTWEWIKVGDRLVLRFLQNVIEEILDDDTENIFMTPPIVVTSFTAAEEWSEVFPPIDRTGTGNANVHPIPEPSNIFSILVFSLSALAIKLKNKNYKNPSL